MIQYVAHCVYGYYGKDVTVHVDKRLDDMPYAQAGISKQGEETWLISYETAVARVTRDGWLYVSGLYSRTTRKHISAFLKEMKRFYAFRPDLATFYIAKYCVEKNVEINLWNGDERKVNCNA